jgi:hypothetical protein
MLCENSSIFVSNIVGYGQYRSVSVNRLRIVAGSCEGVD